LESENKINDFGKSVDISVLMNTTLVAKIFPAITDVRKEHHNEYNVNLTTLM
jgi:hypothetical protein